MAWPRVQGENADWRDALPVECTSDTVFGCMPGMGYQVIRTESHKDIRHAGLQGTVELCDLDQAPFELRNLSTDPESLALLAQIQRNLQRSLVEKRERSSALSAPRRRWQGRF